MSKKSGLKSDGKCPIQLKVSRSIKILLDLDGVLITNPAWKADELAEDGYSAFNKHCVGQLNRFLAQIESFELWLSSTRRTAMSLSDFNKVFKSRELIAPVKGYTPVLEAGTSRRGEVESFAKTLSIDQLLIIDDDTSLHDLPKALKARWIPVNPFLGFTEECIQKGWEILH